eukprot:scaffold16169_cov62-Cyclotella_meneghiniana.AAC.1
MRINRSSLQSILSLSGFRPPSLAFDFASYQRDAFRQIGVPGFSTQCDNSSSESDDNSSVPSLCHRDIDSSVSSEDGAEDLGMHVVDAFPTGQDLGLLGMDLSSDYFTTEHTQDPDNYEENQQRQGRKERNTNWWGYQFGKWMQSTYYTTYLAPDVIGRTYEESLDKHSEFRSHFRVPLVSTLDHGCT